MMFHCSYFRWFLILFYKFFHFVDSPNHFKLRICYVMYLFCFAALAMHSLSCACQIVLCIIDRNLHPLNLNKIQPQIHEWQYTLLHLIVSESVKHAFVILFNTYLHI